MFCLSLPWFDQIIPRSSVRLTAGTRAPRLRGSPDPDLNRVPSHLWGFWRRKKKKKKKNTASGYSIRTAGGESRSHRKTMRKERCHAQCTQQHILVHTSKKEQATWNAGASPACDACDAFDDVQDERYQARKLCKNLTKIV
eukprot:1161364-Pelagomonas_calceolata.AAC.3